MTEYHGPVLNSPADTRVRFCLTGNIREQPQSHRIAGHRDATATTR